MKTVSIRNAIVELAEDTDDSILRMEPVLMKWAKRAELYIGGYVAYKPKSRVLTIENCRAELPFDAYKVIDVLPGDHTDQCDAFWNRYSVSSNTVSIDYLEKVWQGLDAPLLDYLEWKIEEHDLVVSSERDGQELTIQYYAFDTDSRGDILVRENHIEAISMYLQYRLAKKERWRKFMADPMLRNGVVQFVAILKDEFQKAMKRTKGEDLEMSEKDWADYSYIQSKMTGSFVWNSNYDLQIR